MRMRPSNSTARKGRAMAPEPKVDCSTCRYGDNGTNPEGCSSDCWEPELSGYEPNSTPRDSAVVGIVLSMNEARRKRDEQEERRLEQKVIERWTGKDDSDAK